MNDTPYFNMLSIVRAHLWHAVSLRVVFLASLAPMNVNGALTPDFMFMCCLWQAAPVLERFALLFEGSGHRLYPPQFLFDSNAPCLRFLEINAGGIVLKSLPPAFAAVTHLQCNFTGPHIYDILDTFPALESFALSTDDATVLHPPPRDNTRYPGRLTSLSLNCPALISSACGFLQYASCARVRRLHIAYYSGLFDDLRASGFPGMTALRRLSIACNASSAPWRRSIDLHCTRNDSSVLEVKDMPVQAPWPPGLLASVTEVTICDVVYWTSPFWFPNATTLTIGLTQPDMALSPAEYRIFDAYGRSHPAPLFVCPELRAIAIVGVGSTTLCAAGLARFISVGVTFRAKTLVTLRLVNLALRNDVPREGEETPTPVAQLAENIIFAGV
ncbi:hypothetical protein AURDEDRAFT_178334 [Auricularia subglabra TFB-10046 SS5]|uniref:F-box domain-containing protein n=1 Tax=Auricularia subglabra (strain TFB-10046 / SS5) TaxID=717982 RepID=J0D1V8_AURST|nr:hypothetical protein AURDEDRAFT_178334 [Auricularia subglabra TFB-10046 SS5]